MAAKPNVAQREIAWENGMGIPYSCLCPVSLQEEKMHSEEYQISPNNRVILFLCLFACLLILDSCFCSLVNDGVSDCLPLPKLEWLEMTKKFLDIFQQRFDRLKD